MEDMGNYRGLHQRGKRGTYYIRVAVPDDLLNEIGRSEWVRSLRTPDYAQAKKQWALENAKIELEIDAKRTEIRNRSAASIDLTKEEALRLRWHEGISIRPYSSYAAMTKQMPRAAFSQF